MTVAVFGEHAALWDELVLHYATAVVACAYAEAVDKAVEDETITRSPWGPGGEILDHSPQPTPELLDQVAELLRTRHTIDAVITDCRCFIEKSGKSAVLYGHYLAMEQMGSGVGLYDYGYRTKFTKGYTEVSGSIEVAKSDSDDSHGDTFTFYVEGTFQETYVFGDESLKDTEEFCDCHPQGLAYATTAAARDADLGDMLRDLAAKDLDFVARFSDLVRDELGEHPDSALLRELSDIVSKAAAR